MKKKIALVSGASGFIGSHLCEFLIKKNFKVVGIDNLINSSKKNLQNIIKNKNFVFYQKDINKINLNDKKLKKINYIFHLCALADIVPSIDNPIRYFNANVDTTLKLLELAKKVKIKKFIYAASSSCYGVIKTKKKISENYRCDPAYPYAWSKYIAEQAIKHWSKVYKIKYVSLRLFNVYGPRHRNNKQYGAVLGTFISQHLKNYPFTIVGDGSQTRDFVYVTDVVKAFWLASIKKITNKVFNVGYGKQITVNQLSKLIDNNNKRVYLPFRPGEPKNIACNNNLIKKELNWKPEIKIEKGIKFVMKEKNYWKNAPVWTKKKIKIATKNWFKFLKNIK